MSLIRIGIVDRTLSFVTAIRDLLLAALRQTSKFFRACFYRIHAKLYPWEYPWTSEQRQARKEAFIRSISREAVCSLASQLNHRQPCKIFDTRNGSFNACFFVEFPHDGTKWVVRIPIETVLSDTWTKVDSEVATMRYVRGNTKIPLPLVCAFGKSETLIPGAPSPRPFLIVEYVPGNPLDIVSFIKDTRERRNHLYSQLIDVIVQLIRLDFPSAGLLRSDPAGGTDPVLGPFHSQHLEEARAEGYKGGAAPRPFGSIKEYVDSQFELIRSTFGRPCEGQDILGAQREIYAIEHVQREADRLMAADGPWNKDSFVLYHGDLRWPNIIVDDTLNITGIIDWEWTASVPRQLIMPPDWITGHSPEWIIGYSGRWYREEYAHFYQVLLSKAETSDAYNGLVKAWEPALLERTDFSVAEVLHHHDEANSMFYGGIFYQMMDGIAKEAVAAFFEQPTNDEFARQARDQAARSKRYTQYLEDNEYITPPPP